MSTHRFARPQALAAGGLPHGVTARPMGERPAVTKPRNLLEQAAMCDDRAWAASLIATALGITHHHVVDATLCGEWPDPAAYWRRLPVEARLKEIGRWLYAEAFELMDHVRVDLPAGVTIGD